MSLSLPDRDRGTNSLSAPVAEEPGEVADAGADVDEAVAVGLQEGNSIEDTLVGPESGLHRTCLPKSCLEF